MIDVCLILDGGYPFGAGPLAAWVDEHVVGLSTIRFAIAHVGAGRDGPREPLYLVPDNVERIAEVYPREPAHPRRSGPLARAAAAARRALRIFEPERRAAYVELQAFFEKMLAGRDEGLDAVLDIATGRAPSALTLDHLLQSPEAWELFARLYEAHARERPFVDRFRAWQATHAPLLRLLRTDVPEAAIYHAVATGHAGLLGALAAARTGAPLVLTIPGGEPPPAAAGADRTRSFAERAAVKAAVEVVAFSEAPLRAAIRAGAPAERCRVIPPGVDVRRFAALRARGKPTAEKDAMLVALVAPVAPDHDVKTFLRAAKLLVDRLDLVDLLVVGRTDDDPAYFRECVLHAQMLGIDRLVRFAGPFDVRTLFTECDCAVTTSAAGGDPLVLVEAMAAGVPIVATDAGPCREVLEGRAPEDRALGPSGIVCPVGDHEAVAAAVERIVRDAALRDRLAAAGGARAERFYRREELQADYLEIYERLYERYARRRRDFPGPAARRPSAAAAARRG